jgi:hypothetical protein
MNRGGVIGTASDEHAAMLFRECEEFNACAKRIPETFDSTRHSKQM